MTVIAIGADHAGYSLKEDLKAWLVSGGHQVLDFGTHSLESVDYPDFAGPVADAVTSGAAVRGVLACGTGMGMAMAANKLDGVRAAVCLDPLIEICSGDGGPCPVDVPLDWVDADAGASRPHDKGDQVPGVSTADVEESAVGRQ